MFNGEDERCCFSACKFTSLSSCPLFLCRVCHLKRHEANFHIDNVVGGQFLVLGVCESHQQESFQKPCVKIQKAKVLAHVFPRPVSPKVTTKSKQIKEIVHIMVTSQKV